MRLTWDRKEIPVTPEEARRMLRDGEPRIIFDGELFITRNLENGEEVLAARRLRGFFEREAPRVSRRTDPSAK